MRNANSTKRRRILFFATYVLLLILVITAGIFIFLQVKDSKADNTNNYTATPAGEHATPAITLTAKATNEPLFYDDFADTSKGWYQGSIPGYTRVIANNTLTLADANHKILPESLPTTELFKDFQVNVTFTLLQATGDDSVGLYVRGDSYLDHDYRIDIYGNSMYTISKEALDIGEPPQVQYLAEPTKVSTLKPPGQPNMICVMMKGSQLVLEVNGKVVNSVTDSTYTSGQIALFVQNSAASGGVEASFKSVTVYPAPEHLPGS